MRKLLALGVMFLASCSSTQGVENIDVYKEMKKITRTLPSPYEKKESKVERKQKREVTAFLNDVPVKYALKAFCYDQKLTCDLSTLSERERITLTSFKGTPEEFLSLVERRTGVKHKKIGDTLVFFEPKLISIKAVNLPLGEFL